MLGIKINSILDQMNEGFILLDENQSVLMCNIKAKQLFDSQMELNHSVEDYIFDYLKNTYDKELNNEIKMSI